MPARPRASRPTAPTAPLPVVIAGAGLAGSLMAVFLARRGVDVELVERRPDPRTGDGPAGKSINLALSVRGLTALDAVGLRDKVMAEAIPMAGRMLHALDGSTQLQPYGARGECIHSVSRAALNHVLLDAAEATGRVRIHFAQRIDEVHLDDAALDTTGPDGHARRIAGRLLIGADGAYSVVRARMQRTDRFAYAQDYIAHGYKELVIPPDAAGRHQLSREALHIWPRGRFMMIALPNPDGSFTCTLFLDHEGSHGQPGFDGLRSDDEVRAFFHAWFPDALPLMPTLTEDFRHNPTSSLVYVHCDPWHRGRSVLIGDAAHAVVPFFGQGMNCAFEDCRELDGLIDTIGLERLDTLLPTFTRLRKPNADAISALALRNFVEMRDTVASPLFQARKKIEHTLERRFPDHFRSLYSMVSFSNIPYAEAVERAARQDRLLSGALLGAGGIGMASALRLGRSKP